MQTLEAQAFSAICDFGILVGCFWHFIWLVAKLSVSRNSVAYI